MKYLARVGFFGTIAAAWAAAAGVAAEPPLIRGEADRQAAALVEKLGDASYGVRARADALLRDLGLKAQAELTAGLSHADPEVRRRCRWILEDVLQADFLNRLDAFVADPQGKREHDLPGWQRFREEIGDGAAERQFYVKMLRRERGLLFSAASSPTAAAESALLRLQQVYRQMTRRDSQQRKSPDLETIAALLFVITDTASKLPDELADNAYLSTVIQQPAFQQALTSGEHQRLARRLLGRWLLCPTSSRLVHVKLRMATQYEIPEGVPLALSALKDGQALGNHIRAYALAAVGQIGGKAYAGVLAEFLDDKTVCYRRTVNSTTHTTEARDVALAWLVHVTEQSLSDYGLDRAKGEFERVEKNPRSSVNLYNLGFDSESEREKAIARWREWVEQYPLPEKPDDAPRAGSTPAVIMAPLAPAAGPPEPESRRRSALLMGDRVQQRNLEAARQLIGQQRYGEAVRRLGSILLAEDDYTIRPDLNVPLLRCLKPEAERLLGSLPPKGLAAYQLEFGSRAARELGAALRDGRPAALEKLVERYFYTRAGAEATLLVALDNLDRGHWQRAALFLARLKKRSPSADLFEPALSLALANCLVRASRPQRARDVLKRLAERQPGRSVEIGGSAWEMFSAGDDPLDWLEAIVGPIPSRGGEPGWLVYRGAPGRNAVAPAGGPYLAAERLSAPGEDLLEKLIVGLVKEQAEQHAPKLPTLHPLVVGAATVSRTPTHLRAVDSVTGGLLWESALEDSLLSYLRQHRDRGKLEEVVAEPFREGLRRRLWEDATFGGLSSDGRRVFGVEGLSFQFSPELQRLLVMPDGTRRLDPEGLKEHNLLTAYDVETGKLIWEIGGPADAAEVRQPGTYFLGPPLPLGGRLYAAARLAGDTRLLELDAGSGELLWDLILPLHDELPEVPTAGSWPQGIEEDASRTAGRSPSYADGILVCPTAEDHLVAVDLATRSVLWLYQPRQPDMHMSRLQQIRMGRLPEPQPTEHWADSSITIAQRRVLFTPLPLDKLICLNLEDGRRQWAINRRDGLYVAGVYGGKVVVVGHGSVWAVRLSDGEPAWPDGPVPLPPGALPAGRGYMTEEHYHLPLSTGEVAAVDLDRGRLDSRARSADGAAPGNLVRCDAAVFSQNVRGLWRFEPLPLREARLAEALRVQPNDAAVLADYGEALLYQGRLGEAVDQLRKAAAERPTERVRDLLVQALIEAVRTDFARFEPLHAEFGPLVEESGQKLPLLRHLADALHARGRHREALETYLELIERGPGQPELEHFGAAWRARGDRWISGRLGELWEDASAADRQAIAERVAASLEDDPAAVRLPYFGSLPPAHTARLALAERLAAKREWLAAEQQMRGVLRSERPEQRREAAARLIALLESRGRYEEAPPQWPSSNVDKEIAERSGQVYSRYPLSVYHLGERFGTAAEVEFDTSHRKLVGHGPLGREVWDVTLSDPPRHVHHALLHHGMPARQLGHLLVAHLGDRVCAVDTLAKKGKLLWSRKTATSDAQAQLRLRIMGAFRAAPNAQALPGSMPLMVVAAPGCVAFQHDRELLGVDPLSGETLWSRSDLPLGCDLVGDGELLLATPPGADRSVAISMRDGRQLGRCRAAKIPERLSTCGRSTAFWSSGPQGARLALEDLYGDRVVWQRAFAPGSRPWLVDGDEVAVVEPGGDLLVVSLADGRPLLKARVDAVGSLEGIVALRSSRRYVLVVNTALANARGNRVTYNYPGHVAVHGMAYGFDRESGERLWSVPLEQQSLRLGQPAEVPVLTFFSRVRERQGNTYKTRSELMCLDKRTGRILHQKKTDGARPNFYEIDADPDKGRVEIRTYTETIRFRFS